MDDKVKVLRQTRYYVKGIYNKIKLVFYCVVVTLLIQIINFIMNCM